jgi:hypothetical protein
MASDNLGPAHPCMGCEHRGKTFTVKARKNLPASYCLHKHGRCEPICWGDALPDWCPVAKGRK